MIGFRELLMIIAAGLIFFTMCFPVNAHEWDADKWAQDQIELTQDMMTCAELIKESIDLFSAECDTKSDDGWIPLDYRYGIQQDKLAKAVKDHTGMLIVDIQDIMVDFKDPLLAEQALQSIEKSTIALQYIIFKIMEHSKQEQQDKKLKEQLRWL